MEIRTTNQFLKDVKNASKQGKPSDKFQEAVRLICLEQPLPNDFRGHSLKGNWAGFRERHIGADLLLIYRVLRVTKNRDPSSLRSSG